MGMIQTKYLRKVFCVEISLFMHHPTQFFMEIKNFILVLLESVVKRAKTVKSGPRKTKNKNAVFAVAARVGGRGGSPLLLWKVLIVIFSEFGVLNCSFLRIR